MHSMPTEMDEYKAFQIDQSCYNLNHICDPDNNLNEEQKEELSNVILGVEDAYGSRRIRSNEHDGVDEDVATMSKQLKMLVIVIEEVRLFLRV
jgi:hypothetical protein